MSWLRIDDKMWRNPKVKALSPRAFLVHVRAMCLCAEWSTDGTVTKAMAREVGATPRVLKELENRRDSAEKPPENRRDSDKKPLWIRHENCWEINDYLEYNPSKAEVDEKKDKRRSRAKNAAAARWSDHAQSDAQSNAPSIAPSNALSIPPSMEHAHAPLPLPLSSTRIPSSKPGSEKHIEPALSALLPSRLAFTAEQTMVANRAWVANSHELRHSIAQVETAERPVAYFMGVCNRVLRNLDDPTERSRVSWPKGVPAA